MQIKTVRNVLSEANRAYRDNSNEPWVIQFGLDLKELERFKVGVPEFGIAAFGGEKDNSGICK